MLHTVVNSHMEDTYSRTGEEATPCHTTGYAAVVKREFRKAFVFCSPGFALCMIPCFFWGGWGIIFVTILFTIHVGYCTY